MAKRTKDRAAERPTARQPARTVVAAPRFFRSKKKLPAEVQTETDVQVRTSVENPSVGEPKVGALQGVRVVKFKVGRPQYLLAYEFHARENRIEVLVGVHENFYRDLPNYLETR